jgi:hypothetical protein
VGNKSVYTFINACSSIMSELTKLKPIPVHFSAHSPYIRVNRNHGQFLKWAHVMVLLLRANFYLSPLQKSENYQKVIFFDFCEF